ncbi:MAG: hypothetical protein AVDCRST_MAG10-3205 [uncultured Acidimicrobiales bacterium]|uniref:N-acetyltransferase domain-containing protein n=1 Tax=uncultured Acidimicrobiales bacterium TaxID=310071 RepID=A0A6J4J5G5_9ACTN|nr:MAG: hypothetical protein AVDCRST_MAG10-3205 [uncultured Acidimicrobiales bacterium]
MTITNSKTHVAVRKAGASDRATASAVLTAGFLDDPVTEWLVPDQRRRAEIAPAMFGLYFDAFQPHGETYLTDDGAGTALWLPPGRELLAPDQLEEFGVRVQQVAGPDAGRVFELGEFFDAHAPAEPHWHLQLLAVRPDHQGRGLGSVLLNDLLYRADRVGDAAYLEATTLRNRALYERHRFECIGRIVVPDGPPLWQMWRSPR